MTELSTMVTLNAFPRSSLLFSSKHLADVHLKTAQMIALTMRFIFGKTSSRTSCVDIVTRKGNDGQVGQWDVQRGIFFALRRLGRNCFTNFVPSTS